MKNLLFYSMAMQSVFRFFCLEMNLAGTQRLWDECGK